MNVYKKIRYTIICTIMISTSYFYSAKNLMYTPGDKTPNQFIEFGIASNLNKLFTEKYGVIIIYENCIIDPIRSKNARKNNLRTALYLTKNHGLSWIKDYKGLPFGISEKDLNL